MKKTILCIISAVLVTSLAAQTKDYYKDKKHEVRISIGSINDDDYYRPTYLEYWNWGYGSTYYGYFNSNITPADYDMSTVYRSSKRTFGALSASYFYHPSWINGRFSIGGSFSYSHFGEDFKERLTGLKVGSSEEYNIAFTPSVRYAWIAKPIFQLYSGIGYSLYYNNYKSHLNTRLSNHRINDDKFKSSFQVTPIGFSVGKDIFAFGEVNLGGRTGTFVGGFGYRF